MSAGHPGPHRLLHRHRVPAGQGRRQDLAHRCGHRHPVRPLGRLRVGGLHHAGHRCRGVRRLPPRWRGADGVALRGGARRLRPADHRRRHRRDGHLRPGLRQRAGHRGDVRRRQPRGRADPHRARRGRQHHQGDHQGHRDRDRRARRDGAVRLLRHVGVRVAVNDANVGAGRGVPARLQRLQPGGPRRRAARCGRGVPLLRPGDQRRRPRSRRGRLRGAPPVPRDPRDHGGHRSSGVRQGRRHRHQGLAARAGHAGHPGRAGADRGRLRPRRDRRWPASSPARSAPAP